jgi:hypothetical protein
MRNEVIEIPHTDSLLDIGQKNVFTKQFKDLELGIRLLNDSKAKDYALTKLEECYIWLCIAILIDN